ncbi:MAG: hypothetical protein KDA16_04940 [Phycisphaerales bacterium]|nr:hypothetical protein [Phycisphaerales bacterium]
MTTRLVSILLGLLALVLLAPVAPAQSASDRRAVADTVAIQLRDAWEALGDSGDFEKAQAEFVRIFDLVIGYAGDDQPDLFEDAAFAVRLTRQLPAADKGKAMERLRYLRDNDTLARTLAFLVDEKADILAGVYNTLDTLRGAQGKDDRLNEFATLTAAVCVVHDLPLVRQINENQVTSESPEKIWKFYAGNEKKMYYGLKGVPGELLVFVVDNPATLNEINWALSNYSGNRAIGKQFFSIAYDYEHFLHNKKKKVTELGFNLPNIKKYGGVCADQAYFAVTVGKSIGVPAVYTTGRGGQVGHAWVGYLEKQGRTAAWNFDEGRYEEYQGVRGNTEDPQRKGMISDSDVSVLAEMIGASPRDVRRATAFLDAARRMDDLARSRGYPPPAPAGLDDMKARGAAIGDQLNLIEQSLRLCPGYTNSWHRVADLARARRLSLDDKQRWAEVLDRLCKNRYPDFTVDILSPMIDTIEDVKDRDTFWERLGKTCGKRKDLVAYCKIEQGKMWEKTGEKGKAYDCYKAVIDEFINDGPFALEALQRAESMLEDAKRGDVLLELYAHAYSRTTKPDFAAVFATQSNWFKIGNRYVYWLERASDRRAQNIKSQLDEIRNAK